MAIEEENRVEQRYSDKRNKLKSFQQIRYLPVEIIIEILLRLQVKSLLKFRSVSKSRCSIISDPFVKTHLNICSKNDDNAHRLMLISRTYGQIIVRKSNLSLVLNFVSADTTEIDYPKNYSVFFAMISIIGSVNGLILISFDTHDLFLWNPTTRISRKLPQSGFKLLNEYLNVVYGFGYDEANDDYKIVGVFATLGNEPIEVMVYSLRANSWRKIGYFPSGFTIFPGQKGRVFKGAIHWLTYLNDPANLSPPNRIFCLHLKNETYSEVSQPKYRESEDALSLNVLGECIFLLFGCRHSHMNVWMMKVYGVSESWNKLGSFSYLDSSWKFMYPTLLYTSTKGEILLEFYQRILCFDLKTNSFKNPYIHLFEGYFDLLDANTYIESLVSPFILKGYERHE